MPQRKQYGRRVLVFASRLVFQNLYKKDASCVVVLDKTRCSTAKYVLSHSMVIVWTRNQWTKAHGVVITAVHVWSVVFKIRYTTKALLIINIAVWQIQNNFKGGLAVPRQASHSALFGFTLSFIIFQLQSGVASHPIIPLELLLIPTSFPSILTPHHFYPGIILKMKEDVSLTSVVLVIKKELGNSSISKYMLTDIWIWLTAPHVWCLPARLPCWMSWT